MYLKTKKIVRPLVSFIRRKKDLIDFFYIQRIKGFDVPDEPFFDSEEAIVFFLEELKKSDVYIEFGGGGSTICAHSLNKSSITIEGDKYFLKQIGLKINFDSKNVLIHRDIGLTKQWSEPVFKNNLEKFKQYAKFPINEVIDQIKEDKDSRILVLIDGRFRVACFLNALLYLKDKSNWVILFDDYFVREDYFVIENFVNVVKKSERMAYIDSGCVKNSDSQEIKNTLVDYQSMYL